MNNSRKRDFRLHDFRLVASAFLAGAFCLAANSASAVDLVLDSGNGYSVQVEPGVTLSRPNGQRGALLISGGTLDLAGQFSGESQFGGGANQVGAALTQQIVANGDVITINATASGNTYDAVLTFWSRAAAAKSDFGTAPAGSTAPGAALAVTLVPPSAVPVPFAALIAAALGIGILALGGIRNDSATQPRVA